MSGSAISLLYAFEVPSANSSAGRVLDHVVDLHALHEAGLLDVLLRRPQRTLHDVTDELADTRRRHDHADLQGRDAEATEVVATTPATAATTSVPAGPSRAAAARGRERTEGSDGGEARAPTGRPREERTPIDRTADDVLREHEGDVPWTITTLC